MNGNDKKDNFSIDWQRTASILFCILFAALAIYLVFKYLLLIFLPFIIAWGISLITNPLASKLSKRLKIKKKPLSAILTSLLLALIFILLVWGVNKLIFEAERLLEWLVADRADLGEKIAELFDRIDGQKLPLVENLMKIEPFREFFENIDMITANAITEAVSALTRGIPGAVISILSQLPSIFLFVLVTIISCFYFSLDLDKIHGAIISLLPKKWQEKLPDVKKRMLGTAVKYLRAYVLLLALTFAELFVGFSVLGVSYPLLIAFLVAVVDILPVLGVGTVLIPWAVIEIIFVKDLYMGIGLAIIYVVVTVIRQITEPKVVAGSLGLPPLAAIVSMYAGFKLIGIFGMIAGPMIALGVRSFIKKPEA